jgi:hypothetical protein
MSGYEHNTMRPLGALELEQVGGGGSCPSDCPMGVNCNCPSATQRIAGAGIFGGSVITTNCAGYVYENGNLVYSPTRSGH